MRHMEPIMFLLLIIPILFALFLLHCHLPWIKPVKFFLLGSALLLLVSLGFTSRYRCLLGFLSHMKSSSLSLAVVPTVTLILTVTLIVTLTATAVMSTKIPDLDPLLLRSRRSSGVLARLHPRRTTTATLTPTPSSRFSISRSLTPTNNIHNMATTVTTTTTTRGSKINHLPTTHNPATATATKTIQRLQPQSDLHHLLPLPTHKRNASHPVPLLKGRNMVSHPLLLGKLHHLHADRQIHQSQPNALVDDVALLEPAC